jgi:hypothetical protein
MAQYNRLSNLPTPIWHNVASGRLPVAVLQWKTGEGTAGDTVVRASVAVLLWKMEVNSLHGETTEGAGRR